VERVAAFPDGAIYALRRRDQFARAVRSYRGRLRSP